VNEIEFIYPLSPEVQDRLRVRATKVRGRIVSFVVQYEAFIQDRWRAVVRYDTAHGFAHRDLYNARGRSMKIHLFVRDYNQALSFAELDLKAHWRIYRERFVKGARK